MNPWPAPSVPKPDRQKHRRRRQAGGGDTRDGRTERRGGQRRTVQRRVTRSGPHGRRAAERSEAHPAKERARPDFGYWRRAPPSVQAGTRGSRAQPARRRASLRRRKAACRTTSQPYSHAGRLAAVHSPAQGSSPAWAETRRAPSRGSVARGAGPSGRARSEGGGQPSPPYDRRICRPPNIRVR